MEKNVAISKAAEVSGIHTNLVICKIVKIYEYYLFYNIASLGFLQI